MTMDSDTAEPRSAFLGQAGLDRWLGQRSSQHGLCHSYLSVCAELLQRADMAEERAGAAEADAALARQELALVRVSSLSGLQAGSSPAAEHCMC